MKLSKNIVNEWYTQRIFTFILIKFNTFYILLLKKNNFHLILLIQNIYYIKHKQLLYYILIIVFRKKLHLFLVIKYIINLVNN